MKKIIICLSTLFVFLFTAEVFAAEEGKEEGRFNPKEAIFSHLGDEYGWSIALPHGKLLEIPLPVILHGQRGWSVFSSSRLREGKAYEGFYIASSGKYAGKIVGEKNGEEYRPLDVSVTKNVLALFITAVVVMFVLFPLKRWYRRNPLLAPAGFRRCGDDNRYGLRGSDSACVRWGGEAVCSLFADVVFLYPVFQLAGNDCRFPGRGKCDGKYICYTGFSRMYLCCGKCIRNKKVLEGNGMAGCAGMVEIPLADIAFDRDFRRLYQTYRFDDPFVCKYDGRTFDYLSTDCADICIRGFGGSGYCRVDRDCCFICRIYECD